MSQLLDSLQQWHLCYTLPDPVEMHIFSSMTDPDRFDMLTILSGIHPFYDKDT